jgi:two-component system sensor histidine kinase DegS
MLSYEQTIEECVQEASRVLSQTGQDISRLAEQFFRSYNDIPSPDGQQPDLRLKHLAQLARQFEKLAERHSRLSQYLAGGLEAPPEDDEVWPRMRILQAQEEERTRLARELEDGVGQLLANAIFELASSRYLLDKENPVVDDGLAALQVELEQGLSDIRQLIADLDPPSILGNFGLVAGLRRYLESYEMRSGLKSTMNVRTITKRLPVTMEVAIFRIIQEALENVRRHAQATQVEVSIYEEDEHLVFSVVDDGIGLQPGQLVGRGRSLGLVSMYERAELLQGKLRMRSDVEKGTQLILLIPYPIF